LSKSCRENRHNWPLPHGHHGDTENRHQGCASCGEGCSCWRFHAILLTRGMIVSHRKQFVFVHIYKTGGTSVKRVLRRHAMPLWQEAGNSLLKRMGIPQFGPQLPIPGGNRDHLTASQLIEHCGVEEWNRLFSFAFVRNPWDWELSHYRHICRQKSHKHHAVVGQMAFSDYLQWRAEGRFRSQQAFLLHQGQIAVDYVGRFENLASDFGYVCQRLGIRRPRLPRLNSSRKHDYRAQYNGRDIECVAEMYGDDIQQFGYAFEDLQPTEVTKKFPQSVRQAG